LSPEIWTIDIETRPSEVYAWGLRDQNIGISQIIRPGGLLMFAAHKRGSKQVEAHAEWDGYEKMVTRAHEIYDQADYVVTFNGVRFDNKHLRASWAELGLPPPSPWRDVDLFRTVGKFNWPSRKLAFVCDKLGLNLKTDPGGFETWDHIIRGNEEQKAKAQRRMIRYCKNDVKITAQLFDRLLPWIDGLNVPLISGGNEEDMSAGEAMCTRCGGVNVQARGWAYTTTYRYRRFCCTDCGGWMRDKKCEPVVNADLRNA
jgi:DNA polymerase elongation subunit (family B)